MQKSVYRDIIHWEEYEMAVMNKSVVLLMYQFSVVAKGIENKLTERGYNVRIVSDDFSGISSYASRTALFVAYLPGDIADDELKVSALSRVIDMIEEGRSRLLFIGEPKYHDALSLSLPRINDHEWVDRPLDMDRFVRLVNKLAGIEDALYTIKKKRILVVDDDPSYAKMVREWIKEYYRVDIVTAGMQAISFLLKVKEGEQVDLILLDYEMPVVDGPQVLQMLRQEPATEHIPVVFLTGLGTKEAVSRVMELKPAGYILKSTPREDLLKYLKKQLG